MGVDFLHGSRLARSERRGNFAGVIAGNEPDQHSAYPRVSIDNALPDLEPARLHCQY